MEVIKVLAKILTNILTALYEPFGFSLLLSFLAMFFYLYAYVPQDAGKGWKSAVVTWYQKFKEAPHIHGNQRFRVDDHAVCFCPSCSFYNILGLHNLGQITLLVHLADFRRFGTEISFTTHFFGKIQYVGIK